MGRSALPARPTPGNPVFERQPLDVRQLDARLTLQAFRISGIAVQLDDLLVGHAGVLMQVVDVLGDDDVGAAGANQLRDCIVTAIGFGADPSVGIAEATAPRFAGV